VARTPSPKTRRGEETGTAVVEFAVLLPLLLAIVFGVIDFSRILNYANDGTHIANEGARWAVVNQNPGGGTLQAYILAQGDTPEFRNNSRVCITFPNGASPTIGDPVQVEVKTTFTWLPYIGNILGSATSVTTVANAVMRLEQLPTTFSTGSGGTGTCP
jgi:hypothetical protein